jgi:hypothetical protein
MGGLFVQEVQNMAGVPVELFLLVADVANAVAGDLADPPHIVLQPLLFGQADLAGDHHHAAGRHRLAGDARIRLLGDKGVENGVRYPVAKLVGMALRDGLGGKDVILSGHREALH